MQQEIGVHWGWWLFWLIVFWPALLFVALSHSKKKAAIRQSNETLKLVLMKRNDKS